MNIENADTHAHLLGVLVFLVLLGLLVVLPLVALIIRMREENMPTHSSNPPLSGKASFALFFLSAYTNQAESMAKQLEAIIRNDNRLKPMDQIVEFIRVATKIKSEMSFDDFEYARHLTLDERRRLADIRLATQMDQSEHGINRSKKGEPVTDLHVWLYVKDERGHWTHKSVNELRAMGGNISIPMLESANQCANEFMCRRVGELQVALYQTYEDKVKGEVNMANLASLMH